MEETIKIPELEEFKKQAKILAEQRGMKPTHAHEYLAKVYGFKTYNGYRALQALRGNLK